LYAMWEHGKQPPALPSPHRKYSSHDSCTAEHAVPLDKPRRLLARCPAFSDTPFFFLHRQAIGAHARISCSRSLHLPPHATPS
jgi:hypothetical protein